MIDDDTKFLQLLGLSKAFCKRFNKRCVTSMFIKEDGEMNVRVCTYKDDVYFKSIDDAIGFLHDLTGESRSIEFFRMGNR